MRDCGPSEELASGPLRRSSRFLHSTASKLVIATWLDVWQTALGRQRRLSSRTLERAIPSKGALARGALRFFAALYVKRTRVG